MEVDRKMDEIRIEQIEDHIKECKHRIEVISRYMQIGPDASKEECIQNIQRLEMVIFALQELQQCRQIGTVEECREMWERQQAKKQSEQSCAEKTHYKCPDCGYVLQTVYADGYRLGNQTKFCEMCGQAIDWSEV